MNKLHRACYLLAFYMLALPAIAGYWIEMAEELEVSGGVAKLGKGMLVLLKLVVFPK